MAFEDLRKTSLSLGLFSQPRKQHFQLDHPQNQKKSGFYSDRFTNLSLALSLDASKVHGEFEPGMVLNPQASSISVISSINSSSVKRDRDEKSKINISNISHSEETGCMEGDVYKSKATSDDQDFEEEGGARKKLRLSKQQSLILEDHFKEHITLNPKQKQALAKQLNLKARQVEVWFQNRRARRKLKQTEIDCELLKKFCETLTDENRKLQKEVQELKAMKKRAAPPFYMPAATLIVCPSCERAGEPALKHQSSSKPRFPINNTKKQFYGHLNNHSPAAC